MASPRARRHSRERYGAYMCRVVGAYNLVALPEQRAYTAQQELPHTWLATHHHHWCLHYLVHEQGSVWDVGLPPPQALLGHTPSLAAGQGRPPHTHTLHSHPPPPTLPPHTPAITPRTHTRGTRARTAFCSLPGNLLSRRPSHRLLNSLPLTPLHAATYVSVRRLIAHCTRNLAHAPRRASPLRLLFSASCACLVTPFQTYNAGIASPPALRLPFSGPRAATPSILHACPLRTRQLSRCCVAGEHRSAALLATYGACQLPVVHAWRSAHATQGGPTVAIPTSPRTTACRRTASVARRVSFPQLKAARGARHVKYGGMKRTPTLPTSPPSYTYLPPLSHLHFCLPVYLPFRLEVCHS